MVKGPSLFGANFGSVIECFKFRASSQTFSPFVKGMNFCRVQAAMTCQANSCAANALFRAAIRFLSLVLTAGMAEFWIIDGRAWGSYPIMRKNGDCEVTE